MAGGGPLEQEAKRWAEDAGLSDTVTFLGMTERVPLYLKASDMFLLTSRWEALPLSIVEAFHAGLPVIATDCGGVSELVDEEVGVDEDVSHGPIRPDSEPWHSELHQT